MHYVVAFLPCQETGGSPGSLQPQFCSATMQCNSCDATAQCIAALTMQWRAQCSAAQCSAAAQC
eukprot:4544524-Alexandrium_andersonii.AAC.1